MPPRLIRRSIFINTVLGSPYRKFDGDILETFFYCLTPRLFGFGFIFSSPFLFIFLRSFSRSLSIKWKIRGIFATLQILFAFFLDLNNVENFRRRLGYVCDEKLRGDSNKGKLVYLIDISVWKIIAWRLQLWELSSDLWKVSMCLRKSLFIAESLNAFRESGRVLESPCIWESVGALHKVFITFQSLPDISKSTSLLRKSQYFLRVVECFKKSQWGLKRFKFIVLVQKAFLHFREVHFQKSRLHFRKYLLSNI